MPSRLFRLGERFIRSPWVFPFALLWQMVAFLRNAFYDWGIFKIYRVPVPVLSVGNLSLGGSGKTPLVILLAEHFSDRKVAILARGYGGGDELKVIHRHVPKAKIYAGADRVALAELAVKDGAELILLDDGFQHRRLHRDWDVVLIDPTAYLLRESKARLKGVDLIASFFPNAASVTFKLKPKESIHLKGSAAIFCGIANPGRFEKTVQKLGIEVVGKLFLGDHEAAQEKQLRALLKKSGAKYLLCTEKDFVKLPFHQLPIQCLTVKASIEKGFLEWQAFLAKIEQRIDNHPHHGRAFNNLLTQARGEHSQRDGGPVVQKSRRSC